MKTENRKLKVAAILALFALNTTGVVLADKAMAETELSQGQREAEELRTMDVKMNSPYHRDSELNVAGKYSACEVEVISSHYDKAGNLHEVVIITDKQGRETTRQVMYKPVGFVPVGTGDGAYN